MQIQPETIMWNTPSAAPRARDVFRMEKSTGDRITGSIPVWGKPKTPEEKITANLAQVADNSPTTKFATALADETATPEEKSFGFMDFVDMINPLQHIPVVGTIYRHLTGDEIGPAARVVGGAAFGGPVGAASGIVNALVQMETGKDLTDNMISSLEDEKIPVNTEQNDTTIAVANLRSSTLRAYNS